jgi:hypothetical protein
VSGLDAVDWDAARADLDAHGSAIIGPLLDEAACAALAALYDNNEAFRSHVMMRRHGFGEGEYKYLAYPLPDAVAALRTGVYPQLVPLANDWIARMGSPVRYPYAHADFLARCHGAGQVRPAPLLLRYGPGDYNCLHQDIYGEHVFPIQLAVLLDAPGEAFEGGEFVLTEQRPRMQSRVEVVPLRRGYGVLFAVNERPKTGAKGQTYRVKMRHGVSRVRAGRRHTLGVIFHDAA